VSRRSHIIDLTCLLMIGQIERYGRWHVKECLFNVGPLYPSNQIVRPVVTDVRLFIVTRRSRAPKGYRLRTPEETATYHRTLPCWSECETVQGIDVDGNNGTAERHIIMQCSERCEAVRQAIRDSAALVGIHAEALRELAVRRHKTRRYTGGDVPYGSGALPRANTRKP
jgi:hypothetical protein